MNKWHLIIDVEKCEGCNNCILSCKDEHVDNEWPGYSSPQPRHGHRWINPLRQERGQYPIVDVAYLPKVCMHCDEAPCVKTSGDSIKKRQDGIVIIDPDKAKGNKEIMRSCPFEMIWWNEEQAVPQKCTFCAHLLDDGWKKPRCVQACPTGALRFEHVEDKEMEQIIESEKLEFLYPDNKTKPHVYYKNLYRYQKCFIGGSISFEKDGVVDCAEGVKVVLRQGNKKIHEATTDNFGDFKIDQLSKNSGKYAIQISLTGYKEELIEVELLDSSINVGNICLSSS